MRMSGGGELRAGWKVAFVVWPEGLLLLGGLFVTVLLLVPPGVPVCWAFSGPCRFFFLGSHPVEIIWKMSYGFLC